MSGTLNTERCYLRGRIFEIENTKYIDARRKYGLLDNDVPTTSEEMTKRLKDGKYAVFSDYKDGRYPCIRWRDPSVKEDTEGFASFQKSFKAATQKTEDAVNILPPADALKSVHELEAFEV